MTAAIARTAPAPFVITRVAQREYRVPSRTTTGVVYVVRPNIYGQLECSCDNAMAGKHTCWHLRVAAEAINAELAARPARKLDDSIGLALLMAKP